jgi:hypothetical protein
MTSFKGIQLNRKGAEPERGHRTGKSAMPVKIWMRVSGNQSVAGIALTGIPTAYLDQGQHLTSRDAP